MPQENAVPSPAVIDLTAIDLDAVDGPQIIRTLHFTDSVEDSEQTWDQMTEWERRMLCATFLSICKRDLPQRAEQAS